MASPQPLSLAVTFSYTPELAPQRYERAAFLTIFASKDVRLVRSAGAASYVRVELDEQVASGAKTGRVTLPLVASMREIPHDASLSVYAFCHTTNKHGEPAINQSGLARFYLKDLLAASTTAAAAATMTSQRMLVPAADGYDKGSVAVRAALSRPVPFAAPTAYDYDGSPAQTAAFARAVSAHVEATRVITLGITPQRGAEAMRAVHAPNFRASGITMPGPFFALVRPDAPSPAAFFENLLDVTLRRQYPRFETLAAARAYLADEKRCSWREVAVVLAKLLCVFSNYCVYLTDKINTGHRSGLMSYVESTGDRYIESFDITLRETAAGDCEDFGFESAMEALDMEKLRFDSAAAQRVQRCRREMECTMNLMGVGGAALSDAGAQAPIGGHMSGRLTPRWLFLEQFRRVRARVPASSASSSSLVAVGYVFEGEPEGGGGAVPAFARTLPILNLEGTGRLEPDTGVDSTGPLHAYLVGDDADGAAAFARLKFSVEAPRDQEHPFFRYSQSQFMPDRAERNYAVVEAFDVLVDRRTGTARSSAVPFPVSRNERDETTALWAGPELGAELRAWAPHVLKHLHPVPAFEAPLVAAAANDAAPRHPLLERLVRAPGAPAPASWRSIDYSMREDQVTAARVAALGRVLARRQSVQRVDVVREPLTRAHTAWLLRVWVN